MSIRVCMSKGDYKNFLNIDILQKNVCFSIVNKNNLICLQYCTKNKNFKLK